MTKKAFFNRFLGIKSQDCQKNQPAGSGLIIVILVLAFMLAVGVAVLTVTSSGPKIAASMRYQEEAFNAAEAGFDAARIFIGNEGWIDFSNYYLKGLTEHGIDIPFIGGNQNTVNPGYFRRLTDEQILSLIDNDHDGVPDNIPMDMLVFFEKPFVYGQSDNLDDQNANLESSHRYTVFLIDNEAGNQAGSNHTDALLVCIGVVRSGPQVSDRILATCRLEIEVEITNR
ncbi:MAG: pilus assembly PilX N-terminal domain-containing protein [Acidobacteriota bacterium]|nr:pilus assembly PilX N-terminal domain-containing protein [Acidobacteriota bacterium]